MELQVQDKLGTLFKFSNYTKWAETNAEVIQGFSKTFIRPALCAKRYSREGKCSCEKSQIHQH